jgi:hypothetical protein
MVDCCIVWSHRAKTSCLGILLCGIWHVVSARPKWGLHALMGCDETWFVMRWEPGQLQTEGGPIYQDGAAM